MTMALPMTTTGGGWGWSQWRAQTQCSLAALDYDPHYDPDPFLAPALVLVLDPALAPALAPDFAPAQWAGPCTLASSSAVCRHGHGHDLGHCHCRYRCLHLHRRLHGQKNVAV